MMLHRLAKKFLSCPTMRLPVVIPIIPKSRITEIKSPFTENRFSMGVELNIDDFDMSNWKFQ